MRGDWRRAIRLCLLLVVAVGVAAAAPATGVSESADPSASSAPSIAGADRLYQTDNETGNNTTVPHRNPAEVESENRLERLAAYLSGDLNDRIGESSIQLSQGEYDAARSALGDEYADSLGKYVDVDGETDTDGASEEYQTVQSTQREYIDTVSEFRETRREYEAARAAGETERARELARDLSQLAEEGESQSTRLVDLYGRISNGTDTDLSETSARISATQSELSEQRDEIVAREFVETRLVVRSASSEISFTDPLVVSGTLETVNGTPIDPGAARFAVGEQTVQATVGSEGVFNLTYRPTTIDADTDELTVEFQPADASVYRASNETVSVDVTQVSATVRTDGRPDSSYGYADSVAIDTTVTVNGTPVVNYPLAASLAGTSLSTATTNESGQSTLSGTVPAAVPVGDAELRVAADREGRAVRTDPATISVPITSEATDLNVSARTESPSAVVVEGRLLTADGEPVDGQPIAVAVDGQPVGTTTTSTAGAYRTAIELPADVTVENATVTVAFDGAGTNLESADAATTVAVTDEVAQELNGGNGAANGFPPSDDSLLALSNLIWVVTGVAIVGIGTVVLLRRRRAGTDTGQDTAEPVSTAEPDPEPPEQEPDVPESALHSATEALSGGRPNDAVVIAYAGVREALATRLDADTSATHWEFYEQCVDRGVDHGESLESLTTGYEKAAYSGLTMSDDDAEALLERARLLLDGSETE